MEDCLRRDGERRSARLRHPNHLPTSPRRQTTDLCAGPNTSACSRGWLSPTLRIRSAMWTRMSLDGIYVNSHSCYRLLIKVFQCHTDQDNHRRMKCNNPCDRLCYRNHPCELLCSDPCGDCTFSVYGVKLPCGHIAKVLWQVPS